MVDKRDIKVLVVDDDKAVRDFLSRFLRLENIEVSAVEDGFKAIEITKQKKFDVVFLDIRMPGMNGILVFTELKKINPALGCIFMTGYSAEANLIERCKESNLVCLRKPFSNIEEIRSALNNALEENKASYLPKEGLSERRAYLRLEISLDVDYRPKGKQTGFIRVKSKDISPGGIGLITPERLTPGLSLEVTIWAIGYSRSCGAIGEVVWSNPIENKPGYFETGIKFIEINLVELTELLIQSGDISV